MALANFTKICSGQYYKKIESGQMYKKIGSGHFRKYWLPCNISTKIGFCLFLGKIGSTPFLQKITSIQLKKIGSI